MDKIYQKPFPDIKTSANPQSGVFKQAVIAGMDRQSRNKETSDKRTGSRVRARDDGQRQKGFTLIELLINKSHSRGSGGPQGSLLQGSRPQGLGISALIYQEVSRFCSACFCLINGKKAGDPRQKHSGMTALKPLRMTALFNHGFTLIELLVVVLIIGVLAAVALPQYQKAVARSRASTLQLLMRSIASAKQDYYLANATHARSFSDLSVSLPANCTTQANDYYGESAVCKDNISLFLDNPGHDAAGVLSGLGDGSRCWLYYHPVLSRKLCASCPGGENYARSLCLGLGFPASSEHDNGSGCSEFVE